LAVRVSAARQEHLHVHRIPPRVRDDREPPLRWDGTAWDKPVIWVWQKQEYFCEQGWTGRIGLIRFNKFGSARTNWQRPVEIELAIVSRVLAKFPAINRVCLSQILLRHLR
jgi:hypothetical protein